MIKVEFTDIKEFHCFRLVLRPENGQRLEIMLHARSLVELIHQSSVALCEWQAQTSSYLIQKITGLSEAEARERGLIAP